MGNNTSRGAPLVIQTTGRTLRKSTPSSRSTASSRSQFLSYSGLSRRSPSIGEGLNSKIATSKLACRPRRKSISSPCLATELMKCLETRSTSTNAISPSAELPVVPTCSVRKGSLRRFKTESSSSELVEGTWASKSSSSSMQRLSS